MNHTEPTPDRILAVARGLFAERGYRGTSVRAITGRAQANLGAVTYHFGSKEKLYEAVIESLVGPLEARVRAVVDGPGTPLERIRRTAGLLVEHLGSHEEQAAIIQHELARQRELPARAQRWVAFLFESLCRLIAEGQAEGSIAAGSPPLLAAAVAAQPFYLAMVGHRFAEMAGFPGRSALADPQVVEHVQLMVDRLLAASRRDA